MSLLDSITDTFRRITGTPSSVRRALDVIAARSDARIGQADDNGGSLIVPWGGCEYIVFVISDDGLTARVVAKSRLRFPLQHLHPNVCHALGRLNLELPHIKYDAGHFADHSTVLVRTHVPVSELERDYFLCLMRDLIERVQKLDTILLTQGYAS
jgi:hypothetical protein